METKNIMIVGVGGQGSLLASKILGSLLLGEGYDVKVSEVHGMSQRGGSVITFVRIGKDIYSPIIDAGRADIVIAFEKLEALRYAHYLKKDGLLFIEVPNGNDALLSLYESSEFADFTYWSAHLYLYNKESLTALINADGNFIIEDAGQVQRYPLSNHLYWLAAKKPGGHKRWDFLNSQSLNAEYKKVLEKNNLCDTLFFRLKKI